MLEIPYDLHSMEEIFVLAFYLIKPLENPHGAVKELKEYLAALDATGRIYLSEEGVNSQMSISRTDAPKFFEWIEGHPYYQGVDINVHTSEEHAFPKLTVKYREQIVALDREVDFSLDGGHITPAEWKKMLEERDEDTVVLDVRNDYEWDDVLHGRDSV